MNDEPAVVTIENEPEPVPARKFAMPARWSIAGFPQPESSAAQAERLRQELQLTSTTAEILVRRGYCEPEKVAAFLEPKLDQLHDPELLPDIAIALDRIERAVRNRETIVLFGDYDVDGISATALMAGFFRCLQYPVVALTPERDNGGYGLGEQAILGILAHKPRLAITLDNGISAHAAIAALNANGIDCIVIDHHHVSETLPPALAVVNPRRKDNQYPFIELCGAGLAFKLAWALAVRFSGSRKVRPELRQFLLEAIALAALGTIADVVPLLGENRVIASFGLRALATSQAPGIRALLRICRIEGVPTTSDVGFRLAPRINAAGRCGKSADALQLLLSSDPEEAERLAQLLELRNQERQQLERTILNQARGEALHELERSEVPYALVLHRPEWHPGVIGIVASRIVDEFHRPAILLASDPASGTLRGSGRSIKGFHLAEAFAECAEHLISGGGHAAAAGLTIAPEKLPAMRAALQTRARQQLTEDDLQHNLTVDRVVNIGEITGKLCEELERMAPFGAANPKPTLAALGINISGKVYPLGRDDKHLSFYAQQHGSARRAVGFNLGNYLNELSSYGQQPFDVAFSPEINAFRGERQVEIHIKAYRKINK